MFAVPNIQHGFAMELKTAIRLILKQFKSYGADYNMYSVLRLTFIKYIFNKLLEKYREPSVNDILNVFSTIFRLYMVILFRFGYIIIIISVIRLTCSQHTDKPHNIIV